MKTTCPECLEQFDVPVELLGKKAKCGECDHVFVVPTSIAKDKKIRKVEKADKSQEKDAHQTAWLSLYLAGLALLMLLYSGNQGGLVAGMVFKLAIESAALFLVWRSWLLVWDLRTDTPNVLVKMAMLVNGLLIALFIFSLLLTLYSLVASPASSSSGGLGNLNDILKSLQDVKKMIPN